VTVQHFVVHELPTTRWRNGNGTTRQIRSLAIAADLNSFAWRRSVADITGDSTFSVFNSVERTIVLLSGDGIDLDGTRVHHRLDTVGAPFVFDGATRLTCTVLGRPSRVLNVMARPTRGRAQIDLLSRLTTLGADDGVLLSVRGVWQVGSEQVGAGTGLWWAGSPHLWRLEPSDPSNLLAAIRWEPRPDHNGSPPHRQGERRRGQRRTQSIERSVR